MLLDISKLHWTSNGYLQSKATSQSITEDFNAKVGCQEDPDMVGKISLGDRNNAGDWLLQFYQENQLKIAKKWFMKYKHLDISKWIAFHSDQLCSV